MGRFSELDIDTRNASYVDITGLAQAQMVLQHSVDEQVVLCNFSVLFAEDDSMRIEWRNRYDDPGVVDLPPAIAQQLRPLLFDEWPICD